MPSSSAISLARSGCDVPAKSIRCFLVTISTGAPLSALRTTALRARAVERFLALAEPLDVALVRALDGERAGRHVPRDDGTGARHRAVADLDGRHEHRVRADLHVVPDHGAVLVPSIVVDGDGRGADVHPASDVRVADVGQVGNLRARPHPGP